MGKYKDKIVTIYLGDEELRRVVHALAWENNRSVSNVVREALIWALSQRGLIEPNLKQVRLTAQGAELVAKAEAAPRGSIFKLDTQDT